MLVVFSMIALMLFCAVVGRTAANWSRTMQEDDIAKRALLYNKPSEKEMEDIRNDPFYIIPKGE